MKKLSNTKTELKKRVAYKEKRVHGHQESIVFFNINNFKDFQEV